MTYPENNACLKQEKMAIHNNDKTARSFPTSSWPRRLESITSSNNWIPAYAAMTK
jgi:hypothetical protein